MAFKLKAGRTFEHPYSEVVISTAYAIIDDVFADKKTKTVNISLLIYINRNARVNNKLPLRAISINVSEPNFTTYFNPTFTTSIWAQAGNYLGNGGLAGTGLVANDWEVDPLVEP